MILEFVPVGKLGDSNATSWGSSGLTPNIMVNLGNHMKVTYKVSEFHLRQKLRLEFAPAGGFGGSNAPSWASRGLTPIMMVILGHHMKVTFKVLEF